MMGMEVLIVFFALVSSTLCQNKLSIGAVKVSPKVNVSSYLSAYGYTMFYTESKTRLEKAISKLQEFASINVTGKLDAETLKLMQTSRCGIKDPIDLSGAKRVRRYNHQGTRWLKNKLTWWYKKHEESQQYTRFNLKKEDVMKVLKDAMSLWEKRTNIEFKEETGETEPDVRINFARYRHNDPFPFDGRGGTLAHAFYPLNNKGLAGDVHFDDDEYFTIGDASGKGRDLMWVATHELGHTLGLDHSSVKDAVMYPWYTGYRKDFDLQYDDIAGIQTIYGGKTRPISTKTTTKAPTVKTKRCPTSTLTAIWFNKQINRYMITTGNNKLYTVHLDGSIADGPLDTKVEFPRIKGAITGSFKSKQVLGDGKEYDVIFTNDKYYIYQDTTYISGPYNIRNKGSDRSKADKVDTSPLKLNFPSWVRIDAVIRWKRNQKIYFFTKDWYWRYDEEEKKLEDYYPRLIQSIWRGLPKRIDSAHSSPYTPHTFFIAGNMIYEFNDRLVKTKKGFPKDVLQSWLKCDRS